MATGTTKEQEKHNELGSCSASFFSKKQIDYLLVLAEAVGQGDNGWTAFIHDLGLLAGVVVVYGTHVDMNR